MRTAWKWFWNDNNLKHISSFWSIVAKSFTKRIRAADVAEKKCNWVRRIWNTINTNANILLKKTFENVREWIFSRCINWTIKIYFRCNYKDQDCVYIILSTLSLLDICIYVFSKNRWSRHHICPQDEGYTERV